MSKVTLNFYRGNTLVRTEICSSEFEAEEIIKLENNMYDSFVIIIGEKNAI